MFEYDPSVPLDYEEVSAVKKEGYTVRDVSYASPHGGRVPAYLVVPAIERPGPAVVFLHPGQGNRTTFLAEAEALAVKGIVSLLIDAPFLRVDIPKELPSDQRLRMIIDTAVDTQKFIQTIVDLRRGIDLLTSLDNVDAERIGYVGHSYGATWGGVLAGVEDRVKAYALMVGFSRLSEWHKASEHPLAKVVRHVLPKERLEQFLAAQEPMDAVHYIKQAAPASLFFQFAHADEFVPKEQADQYYAAASSPKEIGWYQTNHLFTNCEDAYQDRTKWLIKQLGLATE